MIDMLSRTLARLRASLSARAEDAYKRRDADDASTEEQAYAKGESHAYGVASDDVRDAEKDHE